MNRLRDFERADRERGALGAAGAFERLGQTLELLDQIKPFVDDVGDTELVVRWWAARRELVHAGNRAAWLKNRPQEADD